MNNNYQVTSQYGLNTSNGLCGKVVASSELFGDNYFMRFEWFVDEAMPLLCGDDEKAYLAHISKPL